MDCDTAAMTEREGGPATPPEEAVAPEAETSEAEVAAPGLAPSELAAPEPGPPSPWAELPTTPGRVVSRALDVLTEAGADLRRASFYIGLVFAGLTAPLAILLWRLTLLPAGAFPEPPILTSRPLDTWLAVVSFIAVAGVVVTGIESRGVGIALLAARLGRRPLPLRDAVQRTRTVFWRLFWLNLLINVPLFFVQGFFEGVAARLFGGETEVSVVAAALVTVVLFSPIAYVQAGVVLGDVGPFQAVRRSIGMFAARRRTALMVALFEFGSQFVTLFGLTAGLDLVLRFAGLADLGASGDAATAALVGILIVAIVFAAGTLIFTVATISAAPQVVAFLALTRADQGLTRLRADDRRFRWMTRPMVAAMAAGALALVGALSTLR